MATKYGEDIAVLKEQMNQTVLPTMKRIEDKLDKVIQEKADKSELKTFKWLTVPIVILVTAALTGLVYYYLSHGKIITPETSSSSSTSTPSSTPVSSSSTTSNTSTSTTTQPPSSNSGLLDSLPKVQVGQ